VRLTSLNSDILRFIVENRYQPGDFLPTIQDISKSMDASVAKTRESLEVARAFGAVDIKPGRGTRVSDYDFGPAATLSALYAIGLNAQHFEHLREMRIALETHFWEAAVSQLTEADLVRLRALITSAQDRLVSQPIQVPAREHRAFHLGLFARLDNPFVLGVLEAFWEAYEAFGLNLYTDLSYHREVWGYHERIIRTLEAGDIEGSRRLLIEHMNLLRHRELPDGQQPPRRMGFE
jgi:DNA-binding FadR family transcriptional regulator